MAPSRVGDPRPRLMAVTLGATPAHRIRRIGGLHTFHRKLLLNEEQSPSEVPEIGADWVETKPRNIGFDPQY